MELIERNYYLDQLIRKRSNGLVKVITGIRRCGKSYLLDPIYKNWLLSQGVSEEHIIKIELDRPQNIKYYHDVEAFDQYLRSFLKDDGMYYVLLDEIQLVDNFEYVLNGLLYDKNVDVYVTGSNSQFLSSDIVSVFRGRGDPIAMSPLSFSEYYKAVNMDKQEAFSEYLRFGGMPFLVGIKQDKDKSAYLKNLFELTYFRDIVERYSIKRMDILEAITDLLASSIGSLTNPQKIYTTFKSKGEKELSLNTINSYLRYLEDSFLVRKAMRYDVKGRKYISTPQKYYFTDLGLRNAKLNFRQQEESHLMENAIFNELIYRGYGVDVGVVETRKGDKRIQTEVDFVCNQGNKRYYIQSVLNLGTHEKTVQESRPLNNIQDNFRKIILVEDGQKPWVTEDGILVLNVIDFLLNENSLDL